MKTNALNKTKKILIMCSYRAEDLNFPALSEDILKIAESDSISEKNLLRIASSLKDAGFSRESELLIKEAQFWKRKTPEQKEKEKIEKAKQQEIIEGIEKVESSIAELVQIDKQLMRAIKTIEKYDNWFEFDEDNATFKDCIIFLKMSSQKVKILAEALTGTWDEFEAGRYEEQFVDVR